MLNNSSAMLMQALFIFEKVIRDMMRNGLCGMI